MDELAAGFKDRVGDSGDNSWNLVHCVRMAVGPAQGGLNNTTEHAQPREPATHCFKNYAAVGGLMGAKGSVVTNSLPCPRPALSACTRPP